MKADRHSYVAELMARRHNGLVKVITGIRRCGKSYLLSVLFKERLIADGVTEDHIIEIPLDRQVFSECRNPLRLAEYAQSRIVRDGRWNYVFIDEIQLCRKTLPAGVDLSRIAPEDRDAAYLTFYDTLNELRQMEKVDVYVTGSNSKMLSKDIDTNFADRGFQIRLRPFSFAEYCEARNLEDKAAALADYLVWGGMPVAVAEDDPKARARYLESLFDEVYASDISKRYRLRDDYVLMRLIEVLSSATGSLTNPHRLRNSLESVLKARLSDHTVANYIKFLEDAFLFSEARRWDVRGKRYLDFPLKYYSEDPGLRNARLGFRDIEPSHMLENVIYNELLSRGCQVDVGVVPIGNDRHEIDFVVNRIPGKLYIQVALEMPTEAKRRQELLPLRKSDDHFRKMMVCGNYGPLRVTGDGILEVGAIPFLLDRSILDKAIAD